MAGGRDLIAAPPRRAAQHTLYGAAVRPAGVDGGAARWQNGVTWSQMLCGDTGGVLVPSCDTYETEGIADKLAAATPAVGEYDPVIVWAAARCTAATRDEITVKVRQALDVDQHRQLEAEFWRGNTAQELGNDNPYLSKVGTVDVVRESATPYVAALADLQQALADCGSTGRGTIHATVRTVSLWHEAGMVIRDGTTLVDVHGNLVVPGIGYDGSAPGGTVDTSGASAWAYATGLVVADFGPEVGLDGFDQRINDRQVIVERIAGAWFDECCLFGINVDHCVSGGCGDGS